MNGKTIAIVGAGPSIGMSLARRFGREGYRVGLIARNQERLDGYVEELRGLNIDAAAFAADVKDRPALQKAIAGIEARLGAIDILEYSPLIDMYALVDVLSLTVEAVQEQVDFQVLGAVSSVRAVLPRMLERKSGALLFTTGVTAYLPAPSHANGAMGVTAVLRYVQMLYMALKPKGIYVGTVSIGRRIVAEEVADIYWQKVQERTSCETIYGDPRYLAIYEQLVARGYARDYPPQLLQDLPDPVDEAERSAFLIALFHIKEFLRAGGAPGMQVSDIETETAKVLAQAARLRGNEHAAFFGADIDKAMRPFAGAM